MHWGGERRARDSHESLPVTAAVPGFQAWFLSYLAKDFTVQCGVIKCGDEGRNYCSFPVGKHGSSSPRCPQSELCKGIQQTQCENPGTDVSAAKGISMWLLWPRIISFVGTLSAHELLVGRWLLSPPGVVCMALLQAVARYLGLGISEVDVTRIGSGLSPLILMLWKEKQRKYSEVFLLLFFNKKEGGRIAWK